MNRSSIHLLDLPNERLLIILKKLNNIDVLYSLSDINNGRLNILAQENTFTNTVKFVSIDDMCLIDRFCIDILPRIHQNVKCFIIDPVFMERILLATTYPNLNKPKIFHFQQQIVLNYFTDESLLQSIFEQITNLILVNHDQNGSIGRNKVLDGTYVQRDILDYMPQLHSFTFYIGTYVDTIGLSYKVSNEDIRRTLTNIGQQHATSIVNYVSTDKAACWIFSLPFAFDYLEHLGNVFPNIVFSYVTYLLVEDDDPFKHEFFIRIARSFPLLKYLRIFNIESAVLCDLMTFESGNSGSHSIVEYSHLTSLDVRYGHRDYVEQFLNETKTYAPCLTELGVVDIHLKTVTKNFTRDETRHNCVKIKRLFTSGSLDHSRDFCLYFPSLQM
ncbi:unnamed protein product [Rotaria sp. Silwood2]|nr:unnamed protein product [Rotaria sp. Silwood2]